MMKPAAQQKNILNTVIDALPDNRPITSLQLVEEFEKCPKNFQPIIKTYDQDQDADLWREKSLISKRTTRYLCHSKTEGLPDYILETLKIINEKEVTPEGFSQLTRTADTEQKAWRKKQLVYRLAKKGSTKEAVTDIILCSRLRQAPEGFTLAGDLNGILVCFKTAPFPHRPSPNVPPQQIITNLENLKMGSNNDTKDLLEEEYVVIEPSYQLSFDKSTPKQTLYATGVLYVQSDMEEIPFKLNPLLKRYNLEIPPVHKLDGLPMNYDFHLERQVLCTTKSNNSQTTNPFFH